MKLLISIIFAALLMTGCATSDYSYNPPEISRIYDEDGHLVGKIRHNKYVSRIYDEDGHLVGKIRHNKYGSRVYDKDGKLLYKLK